MQRQELSMDKRINLELSELLETYNLPRINHEEMESQNRLIISMEIKSVVKNFPTKKSLGPDGFTGKSY